MTKYVKRLLKWGLIVGLVLDALLLYQVQLPESHIYIISLLFAMMMAARIPIAIMLVGFPLGLPLLFVALGLLTALVIGLPPETKA